jgi:hypothetical protein
MTISPAQVAANRTARLVRENSPVLRYSTTTPKREHLMVVEMDEEYYGRHWSRPMPESEVAAYIDSFPERSYEISDIDHAARCWCQR